MPFELQPCSSSPIRRRAGSAERVVLPVPERPKNRAVTPSAPTLAEQCMGSTSRWGTRKFITPKMDFFISPAYLVPPMRMMRRVKSAMMKAPDRVPSRSGTASNSGAAMTVNAGLCSASSAGFGRTKSWRTKSAVPGVFGDHANGQSVGRVSAAEEVLNKQVPGAHMIEDSI